MVVTCPVDTGGTVTCRLKLARLPSEHSEEVMSTNTSTSTKMGAEAEAEADTDAEAAPQLMGAAADIEAVSLPSSASPGSAPPVPFTSPPTTLSSTPNSSSSSSSSSSWLNSIDAGTSESGEWGEGSCPPPHRCMVDAYTAIYLGNLSMAQLVQRCALRDIDRSRCESREDLIALVRADLLRRRQ